MSGNTTRTIDGVRLAQGIISAVNQHRTTLSPDERAKLEERERRLAQEILEPTSTGCELKNR